MDPCGRAGPLCLGAVSAPSTGRQGTTTNNNKIRCTRKYCFPLQPPEETQLHLEWDSAPVEFYSNVSYACASEDTYLDFDREAAEWNLTCLEGGGWQSPQPWPRCVNSKKTQIYISCFWSCLQVLEGAHLVVQCTI